jgi:hypothetical protein
MEVGDIVRVNQCGSYCEVTEIHEEEAHGDGTGHVWVEILDTGAEATFCLDEVEVVSATE